jgi:lipoprotein-releasing system ATP-binding protein
MADIATGATQGKPDEKDASPFFVLKGIAKRFPQAGGADLEILQDVHFELGRGDSVAIVGASGIGKSTLLHIMGTLERPDKGSLLANGRDVFALEDHKLAGFRNRSVGFVFQFHHLLQEFSAVENVQMPVMIGGGDRGAAREKAVALLDRVGLGDRLEYRVGALSGGEQQRVAIARALAADPVLLLADEPTGNLDRENSRRVHQLLADLNRELRMTLVIVTHNLELAELMDRRVTIKNGILVDLD